MHMQNPMQREYLQKWTTWPDHKAKCGKVKISVNIISDMVLNYKSSMIWFLENTQIFGN